MEAMNLHPVLTWLAFAPPPSPPGTTPDPRGQLISTIGMFAIMGFMFYFLLIRPQRRRQRQLEEMIKSIKAGDKILTSSGIIGVVISVKDKSLSIRSADTKLEILKSSVAEITESGGESAASS